jgi:predicted GNAT family acetyltransferase
MTESAESPVVVNNAAEGRFEIRMDGEIAFLQYEPGRKLIRLVHTEVPDGLQGRGLAGQLARAAFEYTQANGLKAVVLCPFVRTYVKRHPEYAPLVATEW